MKKISTTTRIYHKTLEKITNIPKDLDTHDAEGILHDIMRPISNSRDGYMETYNKLQELPNIIGRQLTLKETLEIDEILEEVKKMDQLIEKLFDKGYGYIYD